MEQHIKSPSDMLNSASQQQPATPFQLDNDADLLKILGDLSSDDFSLINTYAPVENTDTAQFPTQIKSKATTDRNEISHTGFAETNEIPNTSQQTISSFSAELNIDDLLANDFNGFFYEQSIINSQELALISSNMKEVKYGDPQSASVTTCNGYSFHPTLCQPYISSETEYDFAHQQQFMEYSTTNSKKIHIRCQPRAKFRPRTQNESKISSHYIRCDVGVKPEYPTIDLPQEWFFQSDANLIEVALVGLDRESHPYSLENKTSANVFDESALIFKQNEPNVLFFRLTNDDFQNGYKTFMIELIKSKQDDFITKELIRARELDHSMLRFTRIFQQGKGDFHRDDGSQEYSNVMCEAYGEVDVEHTGPRFGPMSGNEMFYIMLKGRVLKKDVKVHVIDQSIDWNYSVANVIKNGNFIYFLMPPYPYQDSDTKYAEVVISYKDEELHRSAFIYKGTLDQELARLNLTDDHSTVSGSSSAVQNFHLANAAMRCTPSLTSSTRKSMNSHKNMKRLQKNK